MADLLNTPDSQKIPLREGVFSKDLKEPTPDLSQVRCAMDVKGCPDGSFVGRDPSNNCMFFPCPGEGREYEKVKPITSPDRAGSPIGSPEEQARYVTFLQSQGIDTSIEFVNMTPEQQQKVIALRKGYLNKLRPYPQPLEQPGFTRISPTLGAAQISPQIPQIPYQRPQQPQPVPAGVNPIQAKLKALYAPLPQLPQIQQPTMRRIFRILPIRRRTKFLT